MRDAALDRAVATRLDPLLDADVFSGQFGFWDGDEGWLRQRYLEAMDTKGAHAVEAEGGAMLLYSELEYETAAIGSSLQVEWLGGEEDCLTELVRAFAESLRERDTVFCSARAGASFPGKAHALGAAGFERVGRKALYRKTVDPGAHLPDEVSQGRTLLDGDVIEEALASFSHSRFAKDSRFPNAFAQTMFRDWLTQISLDPGRSVVGIAPEGRTEGFAVVTVSELDFEHRYGLLEMIHVSPQVRGQGFGARLLAAAEAVVAAGGGSVLLANTQEENERACTLFSTHGFDETGTVLEYHLWTTAG